MPTVLFKANAKCRHHIPKQKRRLTGIVKLSALRLGGAEMVRYSSGMTTRRGTLYAGYRYPAELIGYAVWRNKHWVWRAVDQAGFFLDVLVESRRDKKAAKRPLRKLLKKQGLAPRVLITHKLKGYAAAKREIISGVEHRQHKGLNDRGENSHQPTRRRERIMKRFKWFCCNFWSWPAGHLREVPVHPSSGWFT
jgi:putative transposase